MVRLNTGMPLNMLFNPPEHRSLGAESLGAQQKISNLKRSQMANTATRERTAGMNTLGDFLGGQYGSGKPDKNAILSKLAITDPVMAMKFSGQFTPETSTSKNILYRQELAVKQEEHAIKAGQLRSQAEAASLKYDTAEDPATKEEARKEYIKTYNEYIQKIEPLFAPLRFTADRAKAYSVPTFTRRKNDERMRVVKEDLADAKGLMAESGARMIPIEEQKVRLQAQKLGLEVSKKEEEMAEGTSSEQAAATTAQALIEQDKIINNSQRSDVWKSAIGFPTRLTGAGGRFAEVILRKKSGASIAVQEEASEKDRYLPRIGDWGNKKILADKASYRKYLINNMIKLAGHAWKKGAYTGGSSSSGSSKAPKNTPAKAVKKRQLKYNPETKRVEYVD